jgi:hypothetical protein
MATSLNTSEPASGQLAAKYLDNKQVAQLPDLKPRSMGSKVGGLAQNRATKNDSFICPSRKRLRAEKWISPCSI